MKYVYPATLSREPNGGYSVWFEDLRGCATQGADIAEVLNMAQSALSGWLYVAEKRNVAIPAPSPVDAIPLEAHQTVTLVLGDTDAYRRIVDSFAVKKTLTIPSWLNEKAEKAHINYSSVLKDALIERLGTP